MIFCPSVYLSVLTQSWRSKGSGFNSSISRKKFNSLGEPCTPVGHQPFKNRCTSFFSLFWKWFHGLDITLQEKLSECSQGGKPFQLEFIRVPPCSEQAQHIVHKGRVLGGILWFCDVIATINNFHTFPSRSCPQPRRLLPPVSFRMATFSSEMDSFALQ